MVLKLIMYLLLTLLHVELRMLKYVAAVGDPPLGGAEPPVVAMSCWSIWVRLRRRGARAVGEDGGVGGR